jgi:NADH-quinone oxidoreductase subunit M
MAEMAGRATPMPKYATFFLFVTLASVGLPLLNGFVGEFLVLSGAFQANPWYGAIGATGVIWSACYLLWMYQRVFFGKVTHAENNSLPDLSAREQLALWPTAVAALVMGVAPLLWLNIIDPAVQNALTITQVASLPATHQPDGAAGVPASRTGETLRQAQGRQPVPPPNVSLSNDSKAVGQ